MPRVAIVGAGLVGRSWAMVFARAGWEAVLYDPVLGVGERALDLIEAGLADQARHGLVSDPAAARARISVAQTLPVALNGAHFVQESGPETLEAKRAIWADLDRLTDPAVVIASSTSAIVASQFTKELKGRARCLVGHPVNPPHLVPVVEIAPAPWTDPRAVEKARTIYAGIGQSPILVKKEIDGFILNRLQGAVLAEALRLVGEGYVSAADLDTSVAEGLGLRWSFLGPFATIELNAPGGVPDYCARFTRMYKAMAEAPPGPGVWGNENVAKVIADWGPTPTPSEIVAKSKRRDERLAALAAHKRAAAEG